MKNSYLPDEATHLAWSEQYSDEITFTATSASLDEKVRVHNSRHYEYQEDLTNFLHNNYWDITSYAEFKIALDVDGYHVRSANGSETVQIEFLTQYIYTPTQSTIPTPQPSGSSAPVCWC